MPLDTIAGYSDFHSSYMPQIQIFSARYNVDPAILINEYAKLDKINLKTDKLREIAVNYQNSKNIFSSNYGFHFYAGGEQD